jgi:hypothetical protein
VALFSFACCGGPGGSPFHHNSHPGTSLHREWALNWLGDEAKVVEMAQVETELLL